VNNRRNERNVTRQTGIYYVIPVILSISLRQWRKCCSYEKSVERIDFEFIIICSAYAEIQSDIRLHNEPRVEKYGFKELLISSFLLGLLFDPEHGGNTFLQAAP
jgi:hypothetical protein